MAGEQVRNERAGRSPPPNLNDPADAVRTVARLRSRPRAAHESFGEERGTSIVRRPTLRRNNAKLGASGCRTGPSTREQPTRSPTARSPKRQRGPPRRLAGTSAAAGRPTEQECLDAS